MADLGNGLTLHAYQTMDVDDIRRDLPWGVTVFGKKLENHRELPEAKAAAEAWAKDFLTNALRVLEGK